jgi:hypothetical protein
MFLGLTLPAVLLSCPKFGVNNNLYRGRQMKKVWRLSRAEESALHQEVLKAWNDVSERVVINDLLKKSERWHERNIVQLCSEWGKCH